MKILRREHTPDDETYARAAFLSFSPSSDGLERFLPDGLERGAELDGHHRALLVPGHFHAILQPAELRGLEDRVEVAGDEEGAMMSIKLGAALEAIRQEPFKSI